MTFRILHDPGTSNDSGQALVEFALVLPLLMCVLLGVVGFGDTFWKYQQLSAATSEGARRAIVSRSDANRTGTVVAATRAAAPNLSASDMAVTVSSTWTPGSTVTVSATYPASVTILGVGVWNGTLNSARTMRVEQ